MVDSFPAAHVKWNAQARAEILQACMHLRTNCHGCCSDCVVNGAPLLNREDDLAAQVALQIVLTGLKHFNPVYIVFHGKGNKTHALETIQTAVLYTLETVLRFIA